MLLQPLAHPASRRLKVAVTLALCAVAVVGTESAHAARVSSDSIHTSFIDIGSEINTVTVSQDGAGQIIFTDTTTPPVDADGAGGCALGSRGDRNTPSRSRGPLSRLTLVLE
jgi:beta-lactamase superfamily II metal-dependent hydrolase